MDLLDVSSRMDFQGRHKLVVFLKQELGWEAENTQLRILTYEKVQKYQEEQHKENSYITILGLHKKTAYPGCLDKAEYFDRRRT